MNQSLCIWGSCVHKKQTQYSGNEKEKKRREEKSKETETEKRKFTLSLVIGCMDLNKLAETFWGCFLFRFCSFSTF